MLWLKELDPYIEVVLTNTTAFLPIILKMPGLKTAILVTLYLPTHGKDAEFVSDLADLRNCLDELIERFTDPILYIRGDGNVNSNNAPRVILLQQLIKDYSLSRTATGHNTYHHFVGNGMYDSDIDILLHTDDANVNETVTKIICKQDNLSHHDPILSSFTIPTQAITQPTPVSDIAPRIDHTRTRITWSEEGRDEFCQLVAPHLRQAREQWLDASSQQSMSVLLSLTNNILTKCATMTNKFKIVGSKTVTKSRNTPKSIKLATNKMMKAHKALKKSEKFRSGGKAREVFSCTKKKYRQTVRQHRLKECLQRYNSVDDIFAKPASAYAYIKSCKNTKPKKIELLTVGDETFIGPLVRDGFYKSMTALKQCDIEKLRADPDLSDKFINYDAIIQLCQTQPAIPSISLVKSTKLLESLKKNVSDYFSITALHYLYAGQEGLRHYNCLLNALISDVNNSKIDELNVAHGNILYKGHKKDKSSDRSYRTISSCPFLAKSIDFYLRELYHDCWDSCQAPTQYQGSGSSHELASLLVTEALQYSLHVSNKPVFVLALDAQSAFDRCLRQVLSGELYKAGVPGSAILFMDSRLASRKTVYEWDGEKMGPSEDDTGFEQGGINSSDYYKLYNNEQLVTAQASTLGIDIGSSVISAVGQADDVMLLSNDLYSLQLLVKLTEEYCKKYRVKLEAKKTKLLVYSNKSSELLAKLSTCSTEIFVNNAPVKFTTEAEHVGVVRNTAGNIPNIIHRVAEHKKSLGAVLSAGLARGHRGSPAAALRVHQLHCTPVLFSGLATLVLNKTEMQIIDRHYQYTIQNLQRLHMKTPRSIVFFLAGSLPGEALLHMRQLSLFSMICHLPDDPLHQHAKYALSCLPPSSLSWFQQVRDICLQYNLPHPLVLLEKPVAKNRFKKLVKAKVTEYWQHLLAAECSSPTMSSLRYFDPFKASLLHPHPMWTSAAGNSFECSKSTVLARMVSGRYRTEMMCRFWSSNRSGHCLADTCQTVSGDLEHLLIVCPALQHIRHRLHSLWLLKCANCPPLQNLLMRILGSNPELQVKFILDSTSFPELIRLRQAFGQEIEHRVLYLTRTWAFAIHRGKQKLLGRWPECSKKKSAPPTHPNPSPDSSAYEGLTLTTVNTDMGISYMRPPAINYDKTHTKTITFSGCSTLPQGHSTSFPATTTILPASTPSVSTTTTPLVQFDMQVTVPDSNTTKVQDHELPPVVVPGPSTCSQIPSYYRVAELDKNLPGGGGSQVAVEGCPSSGTGHQQSASFLLSFKPSEQCSQH